MSQSLLDDDGVSNPSRQHTLHDVVARAIATQPSRRRLLLGGLGAAALPFLAGLSGCGGSDDPVAVATEQMLGFSAVPVSGGDEIVVPAGYVASSFVPWGTPINAAAPAWKADASGTAADQEMQVGDNHDGLHFFGFDARRHRAGRAQRRRSAGHQPRVHQPRILLRAGQRPRQLAAALHTGEGAQGPGSARCERAACAPRRQWLEPCPQLAVQPAHPRQHADRDPGSGRRRGADAHRRRPRRHRGTGHARTTAATAGRRGAPTSPAKRTSTATSAGTARARRRRWKTAMASAPPVSATCGTRWTRAST